MVNGWRKIRDRKVGNNWSILYKKGSFYLEFFKDSSWGDTENVNVIIYDSKEHSYMSSLGKSVDTYHAENYKDAKNWADKYMRTH